MRRSLPLLLLLASMPARAVVDTACWYRDLEQLDKVTAPAQAGDNEFFTSADVPPNLIWVLDNSGSMLAQPCATGSGCSNYSKCGGGFETRGNTFFTSRGYKGYTTDADAYDASDPDYCTTKGDARAFSGKDGCYKPGLVYTGRSCSSWPSDGAIWTRDGTSDSAATIENWCGSHFLAYPPNPSSSPATCTTDAQCPTGYACRDETGGVGGTKRCFLPTQSCATFGCPGGYTCNLTTTACEKTGIVVTPPDPFDENQTCTSDAQCATRTGGPGYVCRRSDGRSDRTPRYCFLGYHTGSRFPYDSCNSPSGYSCPTGYSCSNTSGQCERTITVNPPLEQPGGPTSCTSDSACSAGYRCQTAGGGTVGTRRCRLPVMHCATAGFTCPSSTYSCNVTSGACESVNVSACISNFKTYGYDPTGSVSDPAFTGDLLNFSPPKFVTARSVLKEMAPQVKKTRQALITFDSDDDFGTVLSHLGPTCGRFKTPGGQPVLPPASEFTAQANDIISKIGTMQFDRVTPLAETLMTACQYVTSDPTRFNSSVKVKTNTGVGGYDAELLARSGDNDSMCFSCQKNIVVVVTDGEPNGDNRIPARLQSYCSGTECLSSTYLDDVAMFCNREDLRPEAAMSGTQNVTVHTVAFGFKTPTLEAAAAVGGGIHIAADDAAQLRGALAQIVSDVNKRATSFSVASVTTVQTRGSTYAFVPRFKPFAEDLWEGHLFRFKLYNEFAGGCTVGDTMAPMNADKRSRNLNGDGDCNDVFLLDANNKVTVENADGDYMLADVSQPWDDANGWPVQSPPTLATPVWDAAAALSARNHTSDPRTVHTVLDANANGMLEPAEQTLFNEANVDNLLPALALGGAAGEACEAIRTRLGLSTITERDCALQLIRFVRGLDVFDEDKDGARNDPRPRVLGDIFHSSPILVTAPVPSFLCDLGVTTQCLFSLYGPQLTPKGLTAYEAWVEQEKERTQLVVVGANDGMIHAFEAGAWKNGDDPDTTQVETRHLDLGTGRELWAFVPPDILPKLKRLLVRDGKHELFVDGTAMVRDVWVDSVTNPGEKDASEFHTMAVVGEREGGRSWTALDVTAPASPVFRWSWPPVGDTIGLEAGESWNDVAPSAPPIGPVAVEDTAGPLTRGTTKISEKWAVFLNGGYDPNYLRGRAIHALDVWSGAPLWRFAASDASSTSDPRAQLGPVAAPVSLLDLGADATTRGRQDGLFDSAVVGDVLGQVWLLRFHEPLRDDDADGLADNWHGARAFVQRKGETLAGRNPFFQLAEATIAPDSGVVRLYLGSGDRPNIRDLEGGDCGLVNLGACVRKGCNLNVSTGRTDQGSLFVDGTWHHVPNDATLTSATYGVDTAGRSLTCTDPTSANFNVSVTCGSGTSVVSDAWSWGVACDWDSSNDGALCVSNPKPEPIYASLSYTASTERARFYSFRLFDAGRLPFSSQSQAEAYDQAALTDADLGDADAGAIGSTDPDGYYVVYGHQDERTSSAATILGGCVLWNSLKPDVSTVACGSKVADEARLYRAHFATGAMSCGSITGATERSTVRTAIVPPPPPTPVVAFNAKTGEVRYSMVAVEPGVPPAQVNVGAGDLAGTIYWLEVPREVHECRHGTGDCR